MFSRTLYALLLTAVAVVTGCADDGRPARTADDCDGADTVGNKVGESLDTAAKSAAQGVDTFGSATAEFFEEGGDAAAEEWDEEAAETERVAEREAEDVSQECR